MIKKGFTVAEILIAIALVGVLAMMTIPMVMSNMLKAQTGTALVKAISALDMANSLMITEHEMYNLREGCGLPEGDADISGAAGKYEENCFEPYILEKIGGGKEKKIDTYYLTPDLSSKTAVSPDAGYYVYTTKSGPTYIFPGQQSKHFITLWIDTNGINKKPNQMAKDLFQVLIDVDKSGTVIPYGGKEFAAEFGDSWNDDACGPAQDLEHLKWEYCSGSIVENGGKVVYKWK